MSTPHASPLLDDLVAAGAVTADDHGRPVARHFGAPAEEYAAATRSAAVFDRSHRTRLRVVGRAPLQMLSGIVTGRMPSAPVGAAEPGEGPQGIRRGEATYQAVLTPKGKMVTDLWALLPGDEETDGVWLDVPAAGREGLLADLAKFLPPRMARVRDVSSETVAITVVGPGGPAAVAEHASGGRLDAAELASASEGTYWVEGHGAQATVVRATAEVWPPALTVEGPPETVAELWHALRDAGVRPAGLGVWSTLRVETGTPLMGADMDETTIPVEAGIHERAIDHAKGCYTGQEVIVRIRDRGHVNRHLRRLVLGEGPVPAPGTELLGTGEASTKAVARVTSAVESPRFGGVVALAYVRRGVETVRWAGREIPVDGQPTGA